MNEYDAGIVYRQIILQKMLMAFITLLHIATITGSYSKRLYTQWEYVNMTEHVTTRHDKIFTQNWKTSIMIDNT